MNDENKNNNIENKNATSVLVKRKASSDTVHEEPKPIPAIKSLAAMSINRLLSTLGTPPSVLSGSIINIDGGNCWDVTYDIFREFGESTVLIDPHYLDHYNERELNVDFRAFLFDVMIHIAYRLKFHHQTLMLGLHIVDRYLSTKHSPLPEKRQLLQIGAAAMLLAYKHEELAGAEDLLTAILACIPPETIDQVYPLSMCIIPPPPPPLFRLL